MLAEARLRTQRGRTPRGAAGAYGTRRRARWGGPADAGRRAVRVAELVPVRDGLRPADAAWHLLPQGVLVCHGRTLTAGVWSAVVGLSAASVIGGNQTAAGIRGEVGGGAAGDVALVAIMLGAILSVCANAYSSSLAFQAAGVAVKRPILTVGISGAALGVVLWMQTGPVSAHFEEVLLLADYWIAAFVPIVIIDWLRRRREYTADRLTEAMPLHRLPPGWPALIAFVAGFGVMIPFMDTTLYEGPVATALKGGDLAYPAGFAAAAVLYWLLLRLRREAPCSIPAQPGGTRREVPGSDG
jgi:purine-cytosine permease-like protein